MRAMLLAAALLVAPAAGAQDDLCRKAEALPKKQLLVILGVLYTNGCLGRDRDPDPLTKRVGEELRRQVKADGVRHSSEEQKMVVLWTLDQVRDALRAAPTRQGSAAAGVLASLMASVERTRAVVLDAPPQEKNLANAGAWQWNTRTGRFAGGQADLNPLQAECADEASAACSEAFDAGKRALRGGTLIERAFTFQALPLLEEARIDAARRNRMWHAYFDDARVQLPLELAINSYLYREAAKKEDGFAETPNYQVIFLHPSAGLQYVGAAAAGSRFEPALLVEIAGINGWRWQADGSMGTALGASVVTSYSDRAGAKGTGAGVMLHVNHRYSIALTRHDGRLGVALSTDLARLFTKAEDKDRADFRLGR
jgi:hypothetical protein